MSVDSNADAVSRDINPLLPAFHEELKAVVTSPATKAKRFARLKSISIRVMEKIIPHTPCTQKCSHCCHMAVAISEHEASIIAKHIGRKYVKQPYVRDPHHLMEIHRRWIASYTAVPCTFLKDGQCSIYEVRPLPCILHHTVSDTNSCCDLYKRPREITPAVDMAMIEKAHVFVCKDDAYGDIREFFPNAT